MSASAVQWEEGLDGTTDLAILLGVTLYLQCVERGPMQRMRSSGWAKPSARGCQYAVLTSGDKQSGNDKQWFFTGRFWHRMQHPLPHRHRGGPTDSTRPNTWRSYGALLCPDGGMPSGHPAQRPPLGSARPAGKGMEGNSTTTNPHNHANPAGNIASTFARVGAQRGPGGIQGGNGGEGGVDGVGVHQDRSPLRAFCTSCGPVCKPYRRPWISCAWPHASTTAAANSHRGGGGFENKEGGGWSSPQLVHF